MPVASLVASHATVAAVSRDAVLQTGVTAFRAGNYTEARTLLMPLARHGNARAQYYVGNLLALDGGVPGNAGRAIDWFRRAALQGFAPAQVNLGSAYAAGNGVKRDPRLAVKWFRAAAAQGNALAQYNLGVAYQRGDGVPLEPRQAMRWFYRAAVQDNSFALNNLGVAYATGRGEPLNRVMAYALFSRAAALNPGDVPALGNRARLVSMLTLPELRAARRLARDFVAASDFKTAYDRVRLAMHPLVRKPMPAPAPGAPGHKRRLKGAPSEGVYQARRRSNREQGTDAASQASARLTRA
ncbi:MAG TPA: tetratricopeptide repeat protein [Nevskiaceae bacterium]|nr:tetratricopeptide repeat protein [Nevskiaceae bacterium]